MSTLSSGQIAFIVIACPLLLWSVASIATCAGTRHSSRILAPRCVWIHETARHHAHRTHWLLLALGGMLVLATLALS